MSAHTDDLHGRLPSRPEREAANRLREILAASAADAATVSLRTGLDASRDADIVLTPALSAMLMEVLGVIGRGDAVTLLPVSRRLTTQQAADILDVSRPFLIGLLERGAIPFEHVGRHRRIRAEDVLAYRDQRDRRRNAALSDLAGMDGDLL